MGELTSGGYHDKYRSVAQITEQMYEGKDDTRIPRALVADTSLSALCKKKKTPDCATLFKIIELRELS